MNYYICYNIGRQRHFTILWSWAAAESCYASHRLGSLGALRKAPPLHETILMCCVFSYLTPTLVSKYGKNTLHLPANQLMLVCVFKYKEHKRKSSILHQQRALSQSTHTHSWTSRHGEAFASAQLQATLLLSFWGLVERFRTWSPREGHFFWKGVKESAKDKGSIVLGGVYSHASLKQ